MLGCVLLAGCLGADGDAKSAPTEDSAVVTDDTDDTIDTDAPTDPSDTARDTGTGDTGDAHTGTVQPQGVFVSSDCVLDERFLQATGPTVRMVGIYEAPSASPGAPGAGPGNGLVEYAIDEPVVLVLSS